MMVVAEDYDDEDDSFAYWESTLLNDDIAHGSAKSVDMSHRINIGGHFLYIRFLLPRFT